MPARDTYRIEATIEGEYEDAPTWRHEHVDYLAPDQDRDVAMANVMRGVALQIAPESGDGRSEVAILAALDAARAATINESAGPATRDVILARLWGLAAALNIEWYGLGRPSALDETDGPAG